MAEDRIGASWARVSRVGVHKELAAVIDAAAHQLNIDNPNLTVIVIEGARTHKRQRQLFNAGASKTLQSKHIPELNPTHHAEAVDVAIALNGKIRWDWPLYEAFAGYVKIAAARQAIKITWGGDWPRFRDGPHFQIG